MRASYAVPLRNGYTRAYEAAGNDGFQILFLDFLHESLGTTLFDRFRSLDPTNRNVDCIVLRGRGPRFVAAVKSENLLWRMIGDTPTIALCGALENGAIEILTEHPFRAPSFELNKELLRDIELKAIIERTGALFEATSEDHYDLPSGDHAAQFLRLGTALQDPIEVTRIVDWLLPKVRQGVGILADTGSILPLLSRLQLDAFRILGFEPPIRVADSYPTDYSILQRLALDLMRELGENGSILVLVSVSSTGKFVRGSVQQLLNMPHEVQIICDTAASNNSGALVHIPIERWAVNSDGQCEKCQVATKIHIDSRTLERVFARTRAPVTISRDAANKHRPFWEAVNRTEAVHVHHDLVQDDGTLRHYGIYLDVAALLQDQWFFNLALEALHADPKPDLVLVPKHATTAAVVHLLETAFPKTEIHAIAAGQFSDDLAVRIAQLTPDKTILIADDGLVSGTTLHNLRPQLHKLFKRADGIPAIRAYAVIARPSRRRTLIDLRMRYAGERAGLRVAYEILLPEHNKCPWCDERLFWTRIASSVEESLMPALEERIARLSGAMTSPILLGGEIQDCDSMSVGSFFGKLKQPAAFAASASAILEQWLTATGDQIDVLPGATKVFYVNVPQIVNNYFADAFGPAVFRTMKQRDLMYVGSNADILEGIDKMHPVAAFPCIVPELLWAAVQGKLPPAAGQKLLSKIPKQTPEIRLISAFLPKL